MTRDSTVLNFSGSFPNRDGICDLTARVFEDTRVLPAAHVHSSAWSAEKRADGPPANQAAQAAVNGFVRHAHPLVLGILGLQPPGNLLGRPFVDQFTRNDLSQPPVQGKKALLGPQGRLPGLVIRLVRSIGGMATMAGDLPATVEAARSRCLAISRIDEPDAIPREMSSRSGRVRARRERRRTAGGIPPRGNNKQRMEVCGLSKARPISCSVSPAFHRLQISLFSIADSPNRFPGFI
jgi:hypothetical protein